MSNKIPSLLAAEEALEAHRVKHQAEWDRVSQLFLDAQRLQASLLEEEAPLKAVWDAACAEQRQTLTPWILDPDPTRTPERASWNRFCLGQERVSMAEAWLRKMYWDPQWYQRGNNLASLTGWQWTLDFNDSSGKHHRTILVGKTPEELKLESDNLLRKAGWLLTEEGK